MEEPRKSRAGLVGARRQRPAPRSGHRAREIREGLLPARFPQNSWPEARDFFDRETFGSDLLVNDVGLPSSAELPRGRRCRSVRAPTWCAFRRRRSTTCRDSPAEAKSALLMKMSFQRFLLEHAKVDPRLLNTSGPSCRGGAPRLMRFPHCWRLKRKLPEDVWQGEQGPTRAALAGMGLSGQHEYDGAPPDPEPFVYYHFPDGNASIARMIVRSLIPGSAPGSTMEDIVTARMDYTHLDRSSSNVRIRLNSTAVQVEHRRRPAARQGSTSQLHAEWEDLQGPG